MGRLSSLADEHVDRALVLGLRADGYEVAVAGQSYPEGETDEAVLRECRRRGSVLLTNDRDFARLGEDQEHAGILLYTTQEIAVGQFVAAIRLVDGVLTPTEVRNQVLWLEQWSASLDS